MSLGEKNAKILQINQQMRDKDLMLETFQKQLSQKSAKIVELEKLIDSTKPNCKVTSIKIEKDYKPSKNLVQ